MRVWVSNVGEHEVRARKEATSAAEHVMARAGEEGSGMVGGEGGGRGAGHGVNDEVLLSVLRCHETY